MLFKFFHFASFESFVYLFPLIVCQGIILVGDYYLGEDTGITGLCFCCLLICKFNEEDEFTHTIEEH